jgi:hypothetical protein
MLFRLDLSLSLRTVVKTARSVRRALPTGNPVSLDPQDARPDDLHRIESKHPGGLEREHGQPCPLSDTRMIFSKY